MSRSEPSAGSGASDVLLAGGFRRITPEKPLPLAGFLKRPATEAEPHSDLEANAILLRCGRDTSCIVQVDALSCGFRLRREILRRFGDRLSDSELLLCASHTHFAPNLDSDVSSLGPVDPDHFRRVVEEISGLLDALFERPGATVRVGGAVGAAPGAVNRRKRCWEPHASFPYLRRRTLTLPAPSAWKDDTVRVACWRSPDGNARPAAVAWNFACHPVGYPGLGKVSSEYVGFTRMRLRKAFGNEIPVVFLPGFMGDIRPHAADASWKWCRTPGQYLHRLLEGPRFRSFEPAEWEAWADGVAEAVETVVRRAGASDDRVGSLKSVRRVRTLDSLMEGSGTGGGREVAVQGMQWAEGLRCIGVSGEVLSGYSRWLPSGAEPSEILMPVGYLDGVFGYLPTARALAEGGYEADESRSAYGLEGRYRPTVEETVGETLRELAVRDGATWDA